MPGTLNDEILRATGGPTVTEGLLAYYRSEGATATNLMDAERQWLKIQTPAGQGTNQDLWMDYLGIALGLDGTLNDRLLQYWSQI